MSSIPAVGGKPYNDIMAQLMPQGNQPIVPAPVPQPTGAKVKVLVSSTVNVWAPWNLNFTQCLSQAPSGSGYIQGWQYGLAESRQSLVNAALDDKTATHILFYDSDILPPVDAIPKLLAANVPVIAGVYWNTLGSGVSAWVNGATIALEGQPSEIIQVHQAGMGFMMVKREVFEQLKQNNIEQPWFYYHVSDKKLKLFSEDFYFLMLLSKLGIFPYVHMGVFCEHIEVVAYDVKGQARRLT